MVRSSDHDMLVGFGGDRFWLSFAAAGSMRIEPHETGFKSGIRITLGGFRGTGQIAPGAPLDGRVVLTLCQEGADEDLVAEAMVNEGAAAVKELHWPMAMDGGQVDYTLLSDLARGGRPQHYPEPSDRKLVDVLVGLRNEQCADDRDCGNARRRGIHVQPSRHAIPIPLYELVYHDAVVTAAPPPTCDPRCMAMHRRWVM